jgi:hypothetical protein
MRTKKVLTLQARGLQSSSPTLRESSNGPKGPLLKEKIVVVVVLVLVEVVIVIVVIKGKEKRKWKREGKVGSYSL